MALVETGSKPLQTNKKDWIFLLKIAGLAALASVIGVGVENFDIVKNLIPEKYAPLLTGIVLPLLVWAVQWISDTREKIIDETEEKTPLPPMTILLLLVGLSFPGTAWGQIAAYQGTNTDIQSSFKPYTLIRMECQPNAKSFVWILRRLPDGFRPDSVRVNDGKELVWTGPPGSYDVDTIYTDENGILQQLFTRVVIEGASPVPPEPTPVPTPDNPNPPKPDNPTPGPVTPLPKPSSKFGYAQIAYDQAIAIPVKDRLALANQISENYGSISAAIFAGGLVDVNSIFKEVRSRNGELSSNASFTAWSKWFDELGLKVNQDWLAKKLNNRSDIAEVFREIQGGVLASIGKTPE